ncbi:MAG: N-acetylmannosamine-6-phosphate 2-epimerase [Thermoleophilaceae bacterium]
MSDALEALRGGLVVSVQAPEGSPLAGSPHMAAIARAAEAGGAAGIRAQDVDAIRRAVALPVIGLRKRRVEGSEVYITPTLEDALAVGCAGADIVAVDATLRPRPGGLGADQFLARLVSEQPRPVLADVDSLEAGVAARAAGAAAVATTLAGYTDTDISPKDPDLLLVASLAAELDCPVFAEGRIATPDQARAAFEAGAFAVVVGTAITDPVALTRGFAAACPRVTHAAH